MHKLDRREFMIGAGGAVLAGAVSPASAQWAKPQQLAMRLPVHAMAPDDPVLVAYRTAVERMKALPANDRRSWTRITQIHIDFCPHGNWYFLPWHRAYLVSLENICRQLLNDPNFALPYWDWTEQRQLPPAFTEATIGGKPNALFNPGREIPPDGTIPSPAVAQDAILRIMAETNFENFGSTRPVGQNSIDMRWLRSEGTATPLENGPHGTVHVTVGGDMSAMGSPNDPIFFLHHSNIDRLWAWWRALGRRNTTNKLWTEFRFNGIFSTPQEKGVGPWNVGVSDVLDHQAFGYTYPDLPGGPPAPSGPPGPPGPPGPQNPPPGQNPPGQNPPPRDQNPPQVAAADAEPPPVQVLATATGQGSARPGGVMSTRLNIQEVLTDSPLLHRDPADAPASAPRGGNPFDALQDSPLLHQPARTPPAPGPASGPASGPEPRQPAAGPAGPVATAAAAAPQERVFTVLENVKASGARAMQVNVFLNHPNPTAATSTDDPHFVGTFGLFGLDSHAAHNGMSVQLDLTKTISRLRQAKIALPKQLEVQVIPVVGRGNAPELKNAERVKIIKM